MPCFFPSLSTRLLLLGWIGLCWLSLTGTGWSHVDPGSGKLPFSTGTSAGEDGNGGTAGEMIAPVSSEAMSAAEHGDLKQLAIEVARSKFKVVDKAMTLMETGEGAMDGDGLTVAMNVVGAVPGKKGGGSGGGGNHHTPEPGGPSSRTCAFDPATCFPAGTAVARSDGSDGIEQVRVGDRVLVPAELAGEGLPGESEAGWCEVRLELRVPEYPQDPYDIVLLRPARWVASHGGGAVGGAIWLEFEDMGVRGMAQVRSVKAHAAPQSGAGQAVTGTFTHRNPDPHELRLGDGRVQEHAAFLPGEPSDWFPGLWK